MTEATNPSALGALGINGKLFLAQLVNFAIVLVVAWKWAYGPLVKAMDAREKKIKQGLKDADTGRRALSEAEEKKERLLQTARIEAHDLVESAKQEAEQERQRIRAAAQEDLDRQLDEARARLRQDKAAMFASLRQEVGDIVMLATEKVTKRAQDADAQRVWIADAIEQLEIASPKVVRVHRKK